jgi:hypothetical protein
MPQVFSAKVSANAGNAVTFGSDGGLHLPSPYGTGGGTNVTYTIDNSVVASGQSLCHTLPCTTAGAAIGMSLGTGFLMPFAVAARARPTAAQIWASSAGVGAQLYCSVFAPGTDGWPGAKLTDLWSIDTTATGVRSATTMRDPNFVFGARVRYWLAFWAYTAAFNVWQTSDTGNGTLFAARQSAAPTTVQHFTGLVSNRGYFDTTVAWGGLTAAPSTVPYTPPANIGIGTRMPMVWWTLTNL